MSVPFIEAFLTDHLESRQTDRRRGFFTKSKIAKIKKLDKQIGVGEQFPLSHREGRPSLAKSECAER